MIAKKTRKNKSFWFFIFSAAVFGGSLLFWIKFAAPDTFVKITTPEPTKSPTPGQIYISPSVVPTKTPVATPKPTPTPTPTPQITQNILLNVPFTSQAPDGQWSDPIFQNACEEASILIAMRWVNDQPLSKSEVINEITAISNFEERQYGYLPYDLSAADTVKLIKDYYDYQNVAVKYNITAEDIKKELARGNLVMAPINGQKLHNPFYTQPGPERHMLVIIGYDAATSEFITNDVGTRHGTRYHYQENIFEQALQDYPTGVHVPIESVRTAMIVVAPKTTESVL